MFRKKLSDNVSGEPYEHFSKIYPVRRLSPGEKISFLITIKVHGDCPHFFEITFIMTKGLCIFN